MPYKIERIDTEGSLFTLFIIHNDDFNYEHNIPIWEADDFEKKVAKFTDLDFVGWKAKVGKKDARTGN